jgi:hypothetical protein
MPDDPLHVTVECYAGHKREERPRAFTLGDRGVVVDEILDCWLAPDHRYFKVKGDDEHTYVIRHDVIAGRWELTVFER